MGGKRHTHYGKERDYMRVAIYARTSTKDKQDVSNQLHQLRDYTEKQGWVIAKEYVDQESGASSDRAKFQEMFQGAYQKQFDCLLFWDLSRLSREGVLKTLQHLQRLTEYGVKWRSFTQPYLDTMGPFGDAIVGILAALAQQERESHIARVKAGMARAKREGKDMGRPKKIYDRQKVVDLRGEGKSYRAIGKELGISRTQVMRDLREETIK